MPYNDGIPKINCYSLTDFHDFDDCQFRFFVRHHLDKKYEIDEGNRASALGNLLDQSIKKFHKAKYYNCEAEDLVGIVKAAEREMKEAVENAKLKGSQHFYSATIPFLTAELVNEAVQIFQDFYKLRNKKINPSLDEVGFCEWVIESEPSQTPTLRFKLWGGPDTLEIGEDGVPEIVDYKSRQNMERGKMFLDMDLMPKIYTLLCSKKILAKGYKKARFKVRFWQEPLNEDFFEEYDLETLNGAEFLFRQKIDQILSTSEFKLCNKDFCKACQSDKKDEFVSLLESQGLKVMTGQKFLDQEEKNDLPF